MRKIYLLFVFVSNLLFSQFTEMKFDTHVVFQRENAAEHFYFDQEGKAFMNHSVYPDVDLPYELTFKSKDRYYNSSVWVYLNKYLDIHLLHEIDRAMKTGGKKYSLSEDEWSFDDFSGLRMIHTEVEGDTIRLFLKNMNNSKDYSPIANYYLRMHSWPEVTNYSEVAGKGWILVMADYLMNGNEFRVTPNFHSVSHEDFVFLYFEKQLEDEQSDENISEQITQKHLKCLPYPAVNLDDKTMDKFDGLRWTSCRFYDYFGRYNNEDFYRYYDESGKEMLDSFIKEKELNSKQAATFKEATEKLRTHLSEIEL